MAQESVGSDEKYWVKVPFTQCTSIIIKSLLGNQREISLSETVKQSKKETCLKYKMKHYYIIIAIVGCSAFPAPRPQFPLFGNQPNNTAPANGAQSPSNGFFSGLGGLVNNMMSSLWNFLPIPGRPNANQPQQLPGGIIALPDNFPPPPGMIPLPVSNGSGGFPSLLPPGAFD